MLTKGIAFNQTFKFLKSKEIIHTKSKSLGSLGAWIVDETLETKKVI